MQTNSTAEIYTQDDCMYCDKAIEILEQNNIPYVEHTLGKNGLTKTDLLKRLPMAITVPQIFINGKYIGGFKALRAMYK